MNKTPTFTFNPAYRGKKPLLFRGILGVLVILGVFFIFNLEIVKAGTSNIISTDFGNPTQVNGKWEYYWGGQLNVEVTSQNPVSSLVWGATTTPCSAEKQDASGNITFTERTWMGADPHFGLYFLTIPPDENTPYASFGATLTPSLGGVVYNLPNDINTSYYFHFPRWYDYITVSYSYNYHFIDNDNAIGSVEIAIYGREYEGEPQLLFYRKIDNITFYSTTSKLLVCSGRLVYSDSGLEQGMSSSGTFDNPTTITANFVEGNYTPTPLPTPTPTPTPTNPLVEITQPQNNDILLDNTYNFWGLKFSNLGVIHNLPQLATIKVNYWKTSEPNNVFTDQTLLLIPSQPAEILTYLDKSHDLPVGEYKAQAQLILNDNQTFNSDIITFNIVGETPTPSPPYPTPTISPYPSAQPTLSPPPYIGTQEFCEQPQGGFLDYPVQNITYAICKIFTFLFIPDQEHLNSVTNFLNSWTNTLQKKPPFGWFYSIKRAFESTTPDNINTEYDFTVPVLGDTLKHALIFLFWFLAVIYIIIRIKTIL